MHLKNLKLNRIKSIKKRTVQMVNVIYILPHTHIHMHANPEQEGKKDQRKLLSLPCGTRLAGIPALSQELLVCPSSRPWEADKWLKEACVGKGRGRVWRETDTSVTLTMTVGADLSPEWEGPQSPTAFCK